MQYLEIISFCLLILNGLIFASDFAARIYGSKNGVWTAMKRLRTENGFSLIEVLTVVAIIGVMGGDCRSLLFVVVVKQGDSERFERFVFQYEKSAIPGCETQ